MEAFELKHRYALTTVIGIVFTLAVIGLFQFIALQLLLGYFESPVLAAEQAVQMAVGPNVTTVAARGTGLPVRLEIPMIKVNALVRYVGLTKAGAMGVPSRPTDTAWYMHGPKPGEKGSAVIAGHMNWWYGATGVFAHLHKLRPGDKITVRDDQGKSTTFVVRKTHVYGHKEDASEVFSADDEKSHLNLVTCAGVWDRLTGAYSKRLVVFTDKVEG